MKKEEKQKIHLLTKMSTVLTFFAFDAVKFSLVDSEQQKLKQLLKI